MQRHLVTVALLAVIFMAVDVSGLQRTPRHIPGLASLRAQQTSDKTTTHSSTSIKRQSADLDAYSDRRSYPALLPKDGYEPLALQRVMVDGGMQARDAAPAPPEYPDILENNLTQPLDHFGDSTNATFQQRYWYSLRHYKPNSGKLTPIFVLDSGEVDASTRLSYLDHGILDILANATNGIGVVLEHRYYGTSIPDRSALGPGTKWGVDQLRWLNIEQALADNAAFVQNMTFIGVDDSAIASLRAPHTPVIFYGGSYAGTKSAFSRVAYPDLIFGSLASSAVVSAIEQFPDYFYPIAAGAQQECTQAIQASVSYIDSIIAPEPSRGGDQPNRDANATRELQDLFGLAELSDPADFANLLTYPLGAFQSLSWDPSVTSNDFAEYCTALLGHASGPVDPAPQRRQDTPAPTSSSQPPEVVQNLAKYIKSQYVEPCTSSNSTVEQCFGTQDYSFYTNATELTDQNQLAWTFQYCTQFGYHMTAPPFVDSIDSTTNFSPSGPKLVSSLVDLNYTSEICRQGFLPGEKYTMPEHPRTQEINKYGNFSIAIDRLAFINGQYDPWRPATVHSESYAYGGSRVDTLDRPFKLLANCWHHCDEIGNRTYEPPRVQAIHAQQIEFVQHWLTQWNSTTSP